MPVSASVVGTGRPVLTSVKSFRFSAPAAPIINLEVALSHNITWPSWAAPNEPILVVFPSILSAFHCETVLPTWPAVTPWGFEVLEMWLSIWLWVLVPTFWMLVWSILPSVKWIVPSEMWLSIWAWVLVPTSVSPVWLIELVTYNILPLASIVTIPPTVLAIPVLSVWPTNNWPNPRSGTPSPPASSINCSGV